MGKTAVIPDDKPRTGGFTDLADEIEKLMIDTTNAWLAGEDVPEDSVLQNFVAFHKQVADYEIRDRLGAEPAQALIAEYKALNSFEEFTSKLAEYELAGKPNLMPFGVAPDFMDATTNVLWADSLGIILPDTTYYEEGHEKEQSCSKRGERAKKPSYLSLVSVMRKSRTSWTSVWN